MSPFKLQLKNWIQAARPKTLPLAASGILTGSFAAMSENKFNKIIFILTLLTALLLQILSNLANDYGDYLKGTDKIRRMGPERLVTSGKIKAESMKKAVIIVLSLVFITGLILIFYSFGFNNLNQPIVFILLGITAIFAAIKYTIGKKPYGYYGLGDLMVFIFFGILGVMGSYYLYTRNLRLDLLLPASSIGLLSTGVLNINNLRDYENDKKALKRTFVVLIGLKSAQYYHLILITMAFLMTFIYAINNFKSVFQYMFILPVPLFIINVKKVFEFNQPVDLNKELKNLAISTFIFSLSLGIGLIVRL